MKKVSKAKAGFKFGQQQAFGLNTELNTFNES
jgi:phage-related protein